MTCVPGAGEAPVVCGATGITSVGSRTPQEVADKLSWCGFRDWRTCFLYAIRRTQVLTSHTMPRRAVGGTGGHGGSRGGMRFVHAMPCTPNVSGSMLAANYGA